MAMTPPASEVRAFLAHMRHDLRTPVGGIVGFSDLLIEEFTDLGQADLSGGLAAMRDAGSQLLEEINRLMAESRIDTMTEVRPGEIAAELRNAAAAPLGRVCSWIERLIREADARPAVGSLTADLRKMQDCAREFETLLTRLGDGPVDAGL